MQASVEVRDAVARFYERLSAGDVEGTAATICGDESVFVIGTQRIGGGRAEWLESVRENARFGVVFEAGDIRAWADGGMGWAVDEPAIVLPDGLRVRTRMTAVLRREDDGVFRLLHQHYSLAVPDEVGVGSAAAWREELGLAPA
ncbi:MAG: nuclear transport factor 2 family protein [Actinomycetota bacterium]